MTRLCKTLRRSLFGYEEFAAQVGDQPDLIGQFGVGFYSAFMIASSVRLHTCRVGTDEGVVWESSGDGSYTIERAVRAEGAGTTITLQLKEFAQEENAPDFTDEWVIESTVKKYSDFIAYPVRMRVTRQEPEKNSDGRAIEGKFHAVTEDRTLNSQKSLWLRPAKEITKDEYHEFYKHLTNDWTDPLDIIHYRAEGTQEFTALFYLRVLCHLTITTATPNLV